MHFVAAEFTNFVPSLFNGFKEFKLHLQISTENVYSCMANSGAF